MIVDSSVAVIDDCLRVGEMRSFTNFPFWQSRQVVDIGGVANSLRKSGDGRVDRREA
jgi:hypothetical protein